MSAENPQYVDERNSHFWERRRFEVGDIGKLMNQKILFRLCNDGREPRILMHKDNEEGDKTRIVVIPSARHQWYEDSFPDISDNQIVGQLMQKGFIEVDAETGKITNEVFSKHGDVSFIFYLGVRDIDANRIKGIINQFGVSSL